MFAAVTEDLKARNPHNITNAENAEMADLERVDPGVYNITFYFDFKMY